MPKTPSLSLLVGYRCIGSDNVDIKEKWFFRIRTRRIIIIHHPHHRHCYCHALAVTNKKLSGDVDYLLLRHLVYYRSTAVRNAVSGTLFVARSTCQFT